jgi:hypothetical protein
LKAWTYNGKQERQGNGVWCGIDPTQGQEPGQSEGYRQGHGISIHPRGRKLFKGRLLEESKIKVVSLWHYDEKSNHDEEHRKGRPIEDEERSCHGYGKKGNDEAFKEKII